MAIMRRCCCCGVRGGSTASGWYTLVIGVICLGIFGWAYSGAEFLENLVDEADTWSIGNNVTLETDEAKVGIDKLKTFILVFLIFSGLMVLSSLILLFGICADSRYAFIPWIVCNSIMAILHLADGIYGVVLFGTVTAVIVHLIIMILFAALDVYCVLCVISHFQNLGEGITGLEPQQTMVVIQQNQIGQGQPPPGYGYGQPPPKY